MRVLLYILFFFISSHVWGQELSITPKVFDFGTIKEEDGAVTATFTVKNIGKKPYIMNYSYSNCGCIATNLSKKPIMPGESRVIKVDYDPKRRPGIINKEVVMMSNNFKQRNALQLAGAVIPRKKSLEELYPIIATDGVRLSGDSLPLGMVTSGSDHATIITLYNPTDKSATLGAVNKGKYGVVELSESVIEPNREATLDFTFLLEDSDVFGIITDTVYLTINGKRWKSIEANALVIYDVLSVTDEERAEAPIAIIAPLNHSVERGEEITVKIRNTGKSTLKILGVVVESGEIEYKLKSNEVVSGGESSVTLKMVGTYSASLSLLFNDPQLPIATIRLKEKEIVNI